MTGKINFSKIVATANARFWSQAYSAGTIAVVLSLAAPEIGDGTATNLAALGKKTLDVLETEYFSLEKKSLETIKQAVKLALQEIPQDVEFSFCAGIVINNILYLLAVNQAKAYLQRAGQLGLLLKAQSKNLNCCSGFLKHNDIVILQTKQFSNLVNREQLADCFTSKNITEATENLGLKIHNKQQGDEAAVIFSYQNLELADPEEQAAIIKPQANASIKPASQPRLLPQSSSFKHNFELVYQRLNTKTHFTHQKKIFLSITIIIVLILISSIYFSIKHTTEVKTQNLFQSIFATAQKKYSEGESLKGLNQTLTNQNLQDAKTILDANIKQFPTNSPEEKQILTLLEKVNQAITDANKNATVDKSSFAIVIQNGSGVTGAAAKAAAFLTNLGYKIASVGNADNQNYQNLTITVKSKDTKLLALLKQDLGKNYMIGSALNNLSPQFPQDALIIIGK